jgi:hypothetical protein
MMPAGSHAGEAAYPGKRVGDGRGAIPVGLVGVAGKRVGEASSFFVEDGIGVDVRGTDEGGSIVSVAGTGIGANVHPLHIAVVRTTPIR